jgi:hypothetical protein
MCASFHHQRFAHFLLFFNTFSLIRHDNSSFSQFSIRVTSPRSRRTSSRSSPSMTIRCVSIPYRHACVHTPSHPLSHSSMFRSSFPFFLSRFRDVVYLLQVVLADKYDSYRMTYEGCHVFNPGRFIGRSLGFSTYTPALRESESWYVYICSIYLSLPFPSPSRTHQVLKSSTSFPAS